MGRPATIAARILVLAALVVAPAVLFAPAPASNSPYLSALSDLALGTSAFAKKCPQTRCTTVQPYRCVSNAPNLTQCGYKGTVCAHTGPCA